MCLAHVKKWDFLGDSNLNPYQPGILFNYKVPSTLITKGTKLFIDKGYFIVKVLALYR